MTGQGAGKPPARQLKTVRQLFLQGRISDMTEDAGRVCDRPAKDADNLARSKS